MEYEKRILLVDDDKLTLRRFKSYFQKNGYIVDTAETANQAIRKMQTKDYDVGIFDVTLPDIDGIELLLKIPKKSSFMLKIIITGGSSREIGSFAAENGADEYLVKPVSPEEVLEIFRNYSL
jgi:DNA-binding response OmpR family regulator